MSSTATRQKFGNIEKGKETLVDSFGKYNVYFVWRQSDQAERFGGNGTIFSDYFVMTKENDVWEQYVGREDNSVLSIHINHINKVYVGFYTKESLRGVTHKNGSFYCEIDPTAAVEISLSPKEGFLTLLIEVNKILADTLSGLKLSEGDKIAQVQQAQIYIANVLQEQRRNQERINKLMRG